MNIYEFINNKYPYCFSDNYEKDLKNLKICYLDDNKKYAFGCYFLWYETYGFRKRTSALVLEFNSVINITQPLSSNFDVIETEVKNFSLRYVKEECEKIIQKIKNQYIDKNFSFDCMPINFMTRKQYTIINNNNIIISV